MTDDLSISICPRCVRVLKGSPQDVSINNGQFPSENYTVVWHFVCKCGFEWVE